MPANEQLHAVIEGLVQGVGFRFFVQETAQRLGLTGWVRNRWDGSVELIAEGPRPVLENFLAVLRRGPRVAHVSGVKFTWGEAQGTAKGFFVRPTE